MKGAFTGAAYNKQGLFEIADGGSIFLDEICEMSINLQAKLLRALKTALSGVLAAQQISKLM